MNLEPELLAPSLITFATIVFSGIFILGTTIAFAIIAWKAKISEPLKTGFAVACISGSLFSLTFIVYILMEQNDPSTLVNKILGFDILYIALALFTFFTMLARVWTLEQSGRHLKKLLDRLDHKRAEKPERARREIEDKIKRAYK